MEYILKIRTNNVHAFKEAFKLVQSVGAKYCKVSIKPFGLCIEYQKSEYIMLEINMPLKNFEYEIYQTNEIIFLVDLENFVSYLENLTDAYILIFMLGSNTGGIFVNTTDYFFHCHYQTMSDTQTMSQTQRPFDFRTEICGKNLFEVCEQLELNNKSHVRIKFTDTGMTFLDIDIYGTSYHLYDPHKANSKRLDGRGGTEEAIYYLGGLMSWKNLTMVNEESVETCYNLQDFIAFKNCRFLSERIIFYFGNNRSMVQEFNLLNLGTVRIFYKPLPISYEINHYGRISLTHIVGAKIEINFQNKRKAESKDHKFIKYQKVD